MMIPRTYVNFPKNVGTLFFKTLIKNQLISGSWVDEFEKQFSEYIGTKHAIAVPSGRVGLYLILKSMGIGNEDEIIISSYNSPIVLSVLKSFDAKPIFVDIESDTLNINTKHIRKKITKKTKVIIVLHAEGNPCELDKILRLAKRHNLYVIEDCAHSVGSKYKKRRVGSFGDFGVFSFGIGKSVNTLGGGMIVTNNKTSAQKIRKHVTSFSEPTGANIIKKFCFAKFVSLLMNPFIFSIFIYPLLLFFSLFNIDIIFRIFEDRGTAKIKLESLTKFSNFQAVLGLSHLKTIQYRLERQKTNFDFFVKSLNRRKIKFQKSTQNTKPYYLHFTVLYKNRKIVMKHLLKRGIDVQVPWLESFTSENASQISQNISKQAFYVPMYHNLTKDQIKHIAHSLNNM